MWAISGFVIQKRGDTYNSTYERLLAEDGFIYGVNIPWYRNGNPLFGSVEDRDGNLVAPSYDATAMRDMILNSKAMGFNSVRFWICSQFSGIEIDSVGNVIGLDDYLEDNLRSALSICRDCGMTAELSTFSHIDSSRTQYGQDWYDRHIQIIVNPTIRAQYISNVLPDLCKIFSDYSDVIAFIDVFAEPEGETESANHLGFGTSLSSVRSYIEDVTTAFHNELTNIPVTVASGWDVNPSRYNGLGLDLMGVDLYNADPSAEMTTEGNEDAPIVVLEYGSADSALFIDDDYQTEYMLDFLENAIQKNYKGAYFWLYNGWTADGLKLTHTELGYNNLRPVAAELRSFITGKINSHRHLSISSDIPVKPAMLGSHDPYYVQWIGSSDAQSYTLEGSSNGTVWTTLSSNIAKSTADADGDNLCRISVKTKYVPGQYYYRVTSNGLNGQKIVSDARMIQNPDFSGENLFANGNFESGSLDGWNASSTFSITDTGAYNGDYALLHAQTNTYGQITTSATVKANTEYRFTIWFKASDYDTYGNKLWYRLVDNANSPTCVYGGNQYFFETDSYCAQSFTFQTGDKTDLVFQLQGEKGNVIIDNVILTEIQ